MGRTLFFDYGTMTFQNTDWKLKIHIYTTTGQDFYFITRPVTLRAVDGIVFVVDCQNTVFERNILAWKEFVAYFGEAIREMPIMIALNKQDLPNKFDTARFLDTIEYCSYHNLEMRLTTAISGEGILDCFESVLYRVIDKYSQGKLKK